MRSFHALAPTRWGGFGWPRREGKPEALKSRGNVLPEQPHRISFIFAITHFECGNDFFKAVLIDRQTDRLPTRTVATHIHTYKHTHTQTHAQTHNIIASTRAKSEECLPQPLVVASSLLHVKRPEKMP